MFLRSRDWTENEGQGNNESAHQASRDNPADVTCHRLSEARAFACWQPVQVHVAPQLQTSPHWHDAIGAGAGFWQPQVHSVPTQVSQTQTFD